ncbi:MAG: murein biosynthesis integral membrane protein MurJ, partial [Planctomycetes bacterium]|nr:murein biosynthesis integral membrane protein MurJ [Planctomycetota bacterium]
LVAAVAGTLGAATLVVGALGMIAAPWLVLLFAPGFGEGAEPRHILAAEMLRITFPYIIFISLTSLAGGVLNTWGRFAVPAFTPVLLNICMIAAALWLAPRFETPIVALAWGVAVAGVVQLLFQLPFLARLGMLVWPRLVRGHAGVRRVLGLMLPALFGVSVAQINMLINTLVASFLVTGSVSWLYYSDRLLEFPLGLLGVALGTVILPSLARDHARQSAEAFSSTLDWALRCSFVVALPATVGLAMLAVPLLGTLFAYGEFGAEDVTMAARSLLAFAPGLLPLVLVKVLAPGYYARQDTRTPVRVGVMAMVADIVLLAVLVWPLAHAGLALATALAAALNAALLYRGLYRDRVHRPRPGWPAMFARTLFACGVMAVLLHAMRGDVTFWST